MARGARGKRANPAQSEGFVKSAVRCGVHLLQAGEARFSFRDIAFVSQFNAGSSHMRVRHTLDPG